MNRPPTRLLLISNSTQHGHGYLDHCADEIGDFLADCRGIVFVPFALENWDLYTGKVQERLKAMDLEVLGIHQGDPRRNLERAEAVFCGGGNTFRLLTRLWEFRLIEPIRARVKAGMPYIGSSAGTNVACPTIKTTNDMPIVYPPSFEALGLVPFNINPHYLDADPSSRHQGETREERIREFHEMNSPPVLGLREGAWLRRLDDVLTLGGTTGAKLFRAGRAPEELPPGADLSFLL